MASNLLAMASNLMSDGLQPTSDGLQLICKNSYENLQELPISAWLALELDVLGMLGVLAETLMYAEVLGS